MSSKQSVIIKGFILVFCSILLCCFSGCNESEVIGSLAPVNALDVQSSNWSIGAETMDRGYTVYDNWKQYLGPLGFKKARVFSGWAKTEISPNQYDFTWLDPIIADMKKQGVTPWITLAYGNPMYTTFVDDLRGDPPRNEKAYQAWEAYVTAFVQRYKEQVHEYEVWNEPRPGKKISPEEYGTLVIRTAKAVRSVQPDARIYILALDRDLFDAATGLKEAKPNITDYLRNTLDFLKEHDALKLIDAVTYHPYAFNPDESYTGVIRLREIVKSYDTEIDIIQGENGVPSALNNNRALNNYEWTETSQAKWALRRLLGDLCHDIPSSYFSMADMCYPDEINEKGILKANPDKTIERPKRAYHALQNLASVFDDRIKRQSEKAPIVSPEERINTHLFEDEKGCLLALFWVNDQIPADSTIQVHADMMISGNFQEPVYVDMLTGEVSTIPKKKIIKNKNTTKFTGVIIPDYPVLIAEKTLLKINTK